MRVDRTTTSAGCAAGDTQNDMRTGPGGDRPVGLTRASQPAHPARARGTHSRVTHIPPTQVARSPLQSMPQPPQLSLSVCRSLHPSGQLVCPELQTTTHAPFVHAVPLAQTWPHVPQFDRSVWTSTHAPLQLVCPPEQTSKQLPPEQICPFAHTLPQPPQLVALVCTSTQAPPQLVRPLAQATTQPPPTQA